MELPKLPPELQKLVGKLSLPKTIDPRRDWLLLVALSAAGLAGTVIWSSFFFLEVIGRAPETPGTAGSGAPDTSALEAVRAVAGERAEEVERYRSEYRFVDPSR